MFSQLLPALALLLAQIFGSTPTLSPITPAPISPLSQKYLRIPFGCTNNGEPIITLSDDTLHTPEFTLETGDYSSFGGSNANGPTAYKLSAADLASLPGYTLWKMQGLKVPANGLPGAPLTVVAEEEFYMPRDPDPQVDNCNSLPRPTFVYLPYNEDIDYIGLLKRPSPSSLDSQTPFVLPTEQMLQEINAWLPSAVPEYLPMELFYNANISSYPYHGRIYCVDDYKRHYVPHYGMRYLEKREPTAYCQGGWSGTPFMPVKPEIYWDDSNIPSPEPTIPHWPPFWVGIKQAVPPSCGPVPVEYPHDIFHISEAGTSFICEEVPGDHLHFFEALIGRDSVGTAAFGEGIGSPCSLRFVEYAQGLPPVCS